MTSVGSWWVELGSRKPRAVAHPLVGKAGPKVSAGLVAGRVGSWSLVMWPRVPELVVRAGS